MELWIQNAKLVDETGEWFADLLIRDGKIAAVGQGLAAGGEALDAAGLTVMPAFVDLHCHFRDPGYLQKEDIETGCRAAAKGGYTAVNLMANDWLMLTSTWNTDNLYAGAEVSYEYKDLVALTAHTVYRKWSADGEGDDIGVLYFKPEVEANIKLEVRPVSPLRVHVGFLKTTRTETNGLRMDPVDNLYAGADYNLFKGIAVYARLDNLLNKHYQYYPYIPAEGFNLVGGVSFRF